MSPTDAPPNVYAVYIALISMVGSILTTVITFFLTRSAKSHANEIGQVKTLVNGRLAALMVQNDALQAEGEALKAENAKLRGE